MFHSGRWRVIALTLLLIAGFVAAQDEGDEASSSIEGSEIRHIEWEKTEGARAYDIEVVDEGDSLIFQGRVKEPWADIELKPGQYKIRITVLNRFLKTAAVSPWMDIAVIRTQRPEPTIMEPRSIPEGVSEFSLRIAGSGVMEETKASLVRDSTVLEGRRVAGAKDEAVFVFKLQGLPPGDFDLILKNPAGLEKRVPDFFTIRPLAEFAPLGSSIPAIENGEPGLGSQESEEDAPVPEIAGAESEPESGERIETPPESNDPSPPAEAIAEGQSSVETEEPEEKAEDRSGEAPSLATLRGRRLWVEAGWSGGLFIDPDMLDRYGFGYMGGSIRFLAAFGELFYRSSLMQSVGFEVRTDCLAYEASMDGGSAQFLAGTLGVGFFVRTRFDMPLNLMARGGLGFAITRANTSGLLGSEELISQDSFVYGGVGLRMDVGRHFLDFAPEWTGTFYVGEMVQQLRINILFALAIL